MPSLLLAAVLQIGDMGRIVDLEEPAIAPNKTHVALIAIRQDAAHAAETNDLVSVDLRSGVVTMLVRGSDVAVPRWSPDGSRLAYIARPSGSATHQLVIRQEDGRATQLTHVGGDVIDEAWSPDGRRLAFVAADPPQNSPFFYAGDNDYTATALTPSDHLWVISASGGRARRLTSGSWTIAPTDPGGIFSPQIAWTRDGTRITYTRIENTFSGDSEYSTLWQIDVATRATRKLTAHAAFELSPAYSPDGSRLAYWYPLGGDFNAENTLRFILQGADLQLARDLDRNVAGSLWFPDSRHLLICATDGTQNDFWRVASGESERLALGDLHPVCDPYSSSTFDAGIAGDVARDGSIAFVATTARSARELYYLAAGSTTPRQVTHFNAFLSRFELGNMTELDWTSSDGFAENAVVTRPPNARAGAKYPVVLLIHGGPGLSNTRDFVYEQWPLAQMIASRGYIVLQPNYRGSDNLGNAYMTAIVRNTVVGPSADILAGLTALERFPDVDASRVAVSGWSYGGELTSWLIGHDHRWRAAVSGAAVNSEFEEYNLSTSNVQDRYPLGATPYTDDGWRIYHDNSPITYYAQITTPTLIWGTTLDPVVPITQSYALFHALKENHVPVRFAVFSAPTHGPADPRQRAALTRLWLDWLDEHLH
ncbi:MAG TPA: S9 family peptidase [Candidatus Cybelea sp.]|jgi:dipeptidyl aminopeptidase/acylaminoacyl peptidase|nr:S9 family peptidase [Candidatus Cybelea sp.]